MVKKLYSQIMPTLLLALIVLEVVAYYTRPQIPPILLQLLHAATVIVAAVWLLGLLGIRF